MSIEQLQHTYDVKNKINQVIPEVNTSTTKVVALEGRADSLESRADSLESRADSLETSAAGGEITLLLKSDSDKVAFTLSGETLTLNQDIVVKGGRVPSGSTVSLPTLIGGTDYRVIKLIDGSLTAYSYDVTVPEDSYMIGGFHVYHTTGGINPRSLWDENWKPSANSPRGMTLSLDNRVWVDIYFADTEYGITGYSRPDVTIADGSRLPIKPSDYGGNSVVTYPSMTWFNSRDLAASAGKRLIKWSEFPSAAYGVVEQQSVGTDPVTTKYQAGHRSACGVEQATGVLWIWGADVQGNTGGVWAAITEGFGSVHHSGVSAILLGTSWGGGVYSGSRSAGWFDSPSNSLSGIGLRAACDHIIK